MNREISWWAKEIKILLEDLKHQWLIEGKIDADTYFRLKDKLNKHWRKTHVRTYNEMIAKRIADRERREQETGTQNHS